MVGTNSRDFQLVTAGYDDVEDTTCNLERDAFHGIQNVRMYPVRPRSGRFSGRKKEVFGAVFAVLAGVVVLSLMAGECDPGAVGPTCSVRWHANRAMRMLVGVSTTVKCKEGTVGCGGLCLAGRTDSVCCENSFGGAILCGAGAECCGGICMSGGTGCARQCGPGMVQCGSTCLVGTDEDVCCESKDGSATICDSKSECCDGTCVRKGTACSTRSCELGMIACGGECLGGKEGDTCCLGSSGHGIICAGDAECCDGACVARGEGCAARHGTCDAGLIECGGQCLPGTDDSTCCEDPNTGNGALCAPGTECCKGRCIPEPCELRSDGCEEGTVLCGGVCLPATGEKQTCCERPRHKATAHDKRPGHNLTLHGKRPGLNLTHHSGRHLADRLAADVPGILCDEDQSCCDGVCISGGFSCARSCEPGLVECEGRCVAGHPFGECCKVKTGEGVVCPLDEMCCMGGCVAKSVGCAPGCAEGNIPCGGLCLPGGYFSQCCEGDGGAVLCDAGNECCNGACMAEGTGCAKECEDHLVKCGSECLPADPDSTCCESEGGSGVMCGKDSDCVNGACVVRGTAGSKPCEDGLAWCGDECLPGTAKDCCIGPSGAGVMCGADSECCGGLCEAKGSPCGLSF